MYERHKMSSTRIYKIWCSMKQRCNYHNSASYKDYGAKGISVCRRWDEFNNFYEDMFDSYSKHVDLFGEQDTSLDRIDPSNNYSPENCRWATIVEQANNKNPKDQTKKKKNRVNLSFDDEINEKLNDLAYSIRIRPTTLASMFVEMCLKDEDILNKLKEENKRNPLS